MEDAGSWISLGQLREYAADSTDTALLEFCRLTQDYPEELLAYCADDRYVLTKFVNRYSIPKTGR